MGGAIFRDYMDVLIAACDEWIKWQGLEYQERAIA